MTLFRTIYEKILADIKQGIYKPGDKLPSIRDYAKMFNCNKLTVKKAFDLLKEKELIENIVGKGSFVKFPDYQGINSSFFASSYLSEKFLDTEKIKKIVEKVLRREEENLFSQSPIKGDPKLIKILSEYYNLPEKNIIIISGAQQGIDLTRKVFDLNIKEEILFEDPTYSGAISIFKPKLFIPLKENGPDIETLKKQITNSTKLFYTMPAIHNPTGISYDMSIKNEIAKLAKIKDFYIIEDDYLSEFKTGKSARFVDIIPEKTIFIKSLSKITAPGIRLGFLYAPEHLIKKFLHKKFITDLSSSSFMQKLLYEFIKSGMFESHLQNVKKITEKRKKKIYTVLKKYPFLTYYTGEGYNIWVKSDLDLNITTPPWAEGKNFSFNPEIKNNFRLSVMSLDDLQFETALTYLDTILNSIKSQNNNLLF